MICSDKELITLFTADSQAWFCIIEACFFLLEFAGTGDIDFRVDRVHGLPPNQSSILQDCHFSNRGIFIANSTNSMISVISDPALRAKWNIPKQVNSECCFILLGHEFKLEVYIQMQGNNYSRKCSIMDAQAFTSASAFLSFFSSSPHTWRMLALVFVVSILQSS